MLFPESGIGYGYTVDGHKAFTTFYKVGSVIRSSVGRVWTTESFPQGLAVHWHYKHPDVVKAALFSDRCNCGECGECLTWDKRLGLSDYRAALERIVIMTCQAQFTRKQIRDYAQDTLGRAYND